MRTFVVLMLTIGLSLNSVGQVSIESAQNKIDSLQIYAKESYKIIEEYTTQKGELELLSAVVFCKEYNCYCRDDDSFERRYGLRRPDGEILVPVFSHIEQWGDNYLVNYYCSAKENYHQKKMWMAIIDKNFKVLDVFNPADYNGDWYVVKKDGKFGLISDKMIIDIPFDYEELTNFSKFGEYSYLDYSGEVMDEYKSMAAKKNGKWGIITRENHNPIEFKYNYITNVEKKKTVAKIDDKWGILNREGDILVAFEYDSIKRIGDSFILQKGDKFGIVDYQLKTEDVEYEYDDIKGFCPWSRFGKKGTLWFLLSERYSNGEGYSDIKQIGEWRYIAVKRNEKWAIMQCGGPIRTDFIYTDFIGVSMERMDELDDNGNLIRNYPVYHVTMIEDNNEVVITLED